MSCLPTYKGKRYNSINELIKAEGLEDKFKQLSEQPIKPGVSELFESNPDLANIGTQEQYSQYLDTIFPDSKVKDIVYHGSPIKNLNRLTDEFSKNTGIAFTNDLNYAKQLPLKHKGKDGIIYSSIINLKKPYPVDDRLELSEMQGREEKKEANYAYKLKETKEADGLILLNSNDDLANNRINEYVVFEPEQIHILGSTQDIQGFKESVGGSKSTIKEGVAELFEFNLELAKIGTAEQYSNYLDSKGYNKLYYHYTVSNEKFDTFDKNKIGTANLRNTSGVSTVTLVDNLKLAKAFGQFGLDVYSMSAEDINSFSDEYANNHNNNIVTVGINNSEVNKGKVFKTPLGNGFEINVENTEALDILGGKQDIQGFKEFVSKEEQSSQSEQSSIEFGISDDAIEFSDSIDNAVDDADSISSVEEDAFNIEEDVLQKLQGEEKKIAQKILDWLKKAGITLKRLPTAEAYGVDAVAYAHMIDGVIKLIEGKITVEQLAEEASHFLVEMLGDDHVLFKAMYDKIQSMAVYQEVVNEYEEVYKGDEDKLKREAIARVIAKIINGELSESKTNTTFAKSWLEKLIDWIRRKVFKVGIESIKEDLDAFKQAASFILNEDVDTLLTVKDVSAKWSEKTESPVFYHTGTEPRDKIEAKLQDTKKSVTYDKQTKTYYDNLKAIKDRVSNLVEKFKKERFGRRALTKQIEDLVTLHAKKGTVLHKWLQIIADRKISGESLNQNIISKQVYDQISDSPEFEKDNKKFSDLTPAQFNELVFAAERLLEHANQIQKIINPNEKIKAFSEIVIHDQYKSIAGTIDLLILFSDGSAAVYDFKSMSFKTRTTGQTEPIPMYRKQQISIQLSEYSRILQDVYGVNRIIEARAIPIRMQMNKNKEIGFAKIEMGSEGRDNKYREYLEPIPMFAEETGIKNLDHHLTKLNNLRDKLIQKIKSNYTQDLALRLEKLTKTIEQFQVKKRSINAFNEIKSIIDNFEKRKILPFDHEDALTWEDINEVREIIEIYSDFFANILNYELDKVGDKKTKDLIETNYDKLNRRIALAKRDIAEYTASKFIRETGVDITKPAKEEGWVGLQFKRLSEFSRGQFKVLASIVQHSEKEVYDKLDIAWNDINDKTRKLEAWAKSQGMGLSKAFNYIYDSTTGKLVSKYSGVYGKEKLKAIEDKNYKWFVDNTNVKYDKESKTFSYNNEEDLKKFEEARKKAFDAIDKRFDPKVEEFLNSMEKQRWEYYHDFTVNSEALFRSPYYIRANNNPRFFSEKWLEISKPGNEAVRDYYEMHISYIKQASEMTGRSIEDTFVAEVAKDFADNIASNGVSGITKTRRHFLESIEMKEQDIVKGSFDPATGESLPTIPLLYTTEITKPITNSETEIIKQELISEGYKEGTSEYTQNLANRIYRKERQEGLKVKSDDLSRSLYLFLSSAYTVEYMKEKEDMILALKASMKEKDMRTEMTTTSGKKIVEKFGRKVLEKAGVPADEFSVFNAFVNKYLYGQNLQGKGFGTFTYKDKIYSRDKVARLIMKYISWKGLGLSPIVAAGNSIQTFQSVAVKASEGQYFNKKQLRESQKDVFLNNEKANIIAGYFKPYSYNITFKKANDLSARTISKHITQHNMFILMEKPDALADIILSGAVLRNFSVEGGEVIPLEKAKQKNPNAKSIYDTMVIDVDKLTIPGISDNEANFVKIRRIIQTVSVKTKGMMPSNDTNIVNTNIYLAMLMQFRNWIPPLLKDRTGKMTYDEDLSSFNVGRYNVFFSEFSGGVASKLKAFTDTLLEVSLFGYYNRYNSVLKNKDFQGLEIARKYYDRFMEENPEYRGKLTMEEYIELRKQKIQGMARELRGLLTYALLIFLLKSTGDDDDESIANKLMADNLYRFSNRGLLEMSFFLDPSSAMQILSNPAVSFRIVKDMNQLFGGLKNYSKYLITEEDTKRKKAGKKLAGKTISMIPGTRLVFDVVDFTTMFDE